MVVLQDSAALNSNEFRSDLADECIPVERNVQDVDIH
jgi:hypothetical protein